MFDTVNYKILLSNVECYEIRDVTENKYVT